MLHLAFEDYRRPGSGGGGIRTHEVNKRLAERHQIVVLTTRYPGARRRVEDGCEYRPIGLPFGYMPSLLSYHLALPFYVMANAHKYDLVVEDFAAPMSSVLIPLFTRRPTIAVVQWLFAREASRRYRLPFFVFESLGMRLHTRFVAVSGYMARRIRAANPDAAVDIVYAGVGRPSGSYVPPPRSDDQILFLGRLEELPKGLDLLLDALRRLPEHVRLVIAGDGSGREHIDQRVHSLGLSQRVSFVGRVSGDDKWDLLSSSSLLVVPSRYESFGMVAVEAMTVGTPVVGFAIPALREIVPDDCGRLVEPFDSEALAEAIASLLADPDARASMGRHGLDQAENFSWDLASKVQEAAYLAAAEGGRRGLRARLRRANPAAIIGRGSAGGDCRCATPGECLGATASSSRKRHTGRCG